MLARGFHTIHNRLFLLFLFSMLSLLLVVSGLYYKRTTDQVHDKMGEIAQKNISQTIQLFDLLLAGYDSATKSLGGNMDLRRLLVDGGGKDQALRIIDERTITNLLGSIYFSRGDLIGIHVITYSGQTYSYGSSMSAVDPGYSQLGWYSTVRQSGGEMVWLGVHSRSLIDPGESRRVFTFGRQLYDIYEHKPIGMVMLEVDPQPIESALSNLSLSRNSEVYIVSGSGEIMAEGPQREGRLGPPAAAEMPRPMGAHEVIVERREDRFIVASRPSLADWTVLSLTPEQDLSVELDQMQHFLLGVLSVLIVISTALATFVSRTISSPLKRVIREMRQVEQGNFQGQLQVKSYEEINLLAASFNHMVNRMDELVEREKVLSISEKHAQLLALQTQVNPHFLYNTLDMIYWMLDEQENDRLGRVVLSLSHLFRYSSHWEEAAAVTLREELAQMEHYLTIIGVRLEGRLHIDVRIEERWLDTRLPRMTLQPIIENAVKHGLERLDRRGELRVYTQISGGELQIIVEDNGTGMDGQTLGQLMDSLYGPAVSPPAVDGETGGAAAAGGRRGIGLQNLQHRLLLMFGEAYGLRVRSQPGAGTCVTVVLPVPPPTAEEEDQYEYSHCG